MENPSILVKYSAPARKPHGERDYSRLTAVSQSALHCDRQRPLFLFGRCLTGCALALTLLAATAHAACDSAIHPYVVQGPGEASPIEGETVTATGTVTAVTPDLRGFFIQGPTDGDPRTSEALFIFAHERTVEIGRQVAVTGEVKEFHGLTELTAVRRVTDCGPGEMPEPVALSGHPAEPLENMRVRIPESIIVDNYRLFDVGELVVADGTHEWTLEDASNERRLQEIPWDLPQDPTLVANGNRVGELTGVLTWRWNRWVILPDEPLTIEPADWATLSPEDGQLRLVSFNIENLFNGLHGDFSHSRGASSAAEWARQRQKVASALLALDADLLLLQEMEHDQGSGSAVLAEMAELIASRGGRHYEAIAPNVRLGDDAITNAFLYDPERLQPEGELQRIESDPRPALVQAFTRLDSGATVEVINVHMKSRGRNCDHLCKAERAEEMALIMTWLGAQDEQPFRLLGGDFNTLTAESLWAPLVDAGWQRLDVEAPTYWFRGRAQQLDHIWLHNAPAGISGQVQPGHAEMPPLPWLHPLYDPQSPWGASDHNPVILHW